MRLLIAESDPALGTFLQKGFDAENYAVDLADDGEKVKKLVREHEYDLAILDLQPAEASGIETLRAIRAQRERLPILILTNRNRLQERVRVLEVGADDFVLKPFAFSELSARALSLLRRGGRAPETVLKIEDLELNRVEHTVRRGGRMIELTPKEFSLLEYMMRHAEQRVTRAEIIQHVWNLSFDTMTNVVDVYINYLRKKVDTPAELKLIHTIRGVGYQLRAGGSHSSDEQRAWVPSMQQKTG